MTATSTEGAGLPRVRDALFDVGHKAYALAECVEQVEAVYAKETERLDSGWFYVPSTEHTGLELLDPLRLDRFSALERKPRQNAITATLELRRAIDNAIVAVAAASPHMDSQHESVDRRWTTRTIGQLRLLRGAILKGHSPDIFPSALPMIRVGVPATLREKADTIRTCMEEVKTALLAAQTVVTETTKAPAVRETDVESAFHLIAQTQTACAKEPAEPDTALRSSVLVVRECVRAADVLLQASQHLDRLYVDKRLGELLSHIDNAQSAWKHAEAVIENRMPDASRFAYDSRVLLRKTWNEAQDAFLNPELRVLEKRLRWLEIIKALEDIADRVECMTPKRPARQNSDTIAGVPHETTGYTCSALTLSRALKQPPEPLVRDDVHRVRNWLHAVASRCHEIVPAPHWTPDLFDKPHPDDKLGVHSPIPALSVAVWWIARAHAVLVEGKSIAGEASYFEGLDEGNIEDDSEGPTIVARHGVGAVRIPLSVLVTYATRCGRVILDHFGMQNLTVNAVSSPASVPKSPATLDPVTERLVNVAEAAKAAGVRGDVLLKKLRKRDYKIHGIKGSFTAEFEHIVVALPNKRRQLRRWADHKYPLE